MSFQPVSEEFQNGEGFGYIVAFRANGTRGWKEKMVTSADSTTFKYRDETFPPLTPFEVKVGVYNNKGDGPFSKVVTVYSAEEGEQGTYGHLKVTCSFHDGRPMCEISHSSGPQSGSCFDFYFPKMNPLFHMDIEYAAIYCQYIFF